MEHVNQVGAYMAERLADLKIRHRSVGEVRGMGLFWAVDLAKDAALRTPFHTYRDKVAQKPLVVDQITAAMMQKGVYLVGWVNHFVIAPPLIISRDEIDQGLAALDEALLIADEMVN
jgi:taurine--2-oxoglutarate transaminase